MLSLDDLDTPFPRPSSIRVSLLFEDGSYRFVMTNLAYEDYLAQYLGQQVRMVYYPRSETGRVLRISAINMEGAV
jgi:hypothetical protein